MHKTIVIDGQEYELQITARKVINNRRTAVSMNNTETEELMGRIEDELRSTLDVIDYAAEQREYEASYESDEESRRCMERNAKDWENLHKRLFALLNGE